MDAAGRGGVNRWLRFGTAARPSASACLRVWYSLKVVANAPVLSVGQRVTQLPLVAHGASAGYGRVWSKLVVASAA